MCGNTPIYKQTKKNATNVHTHILQSLFNRWIFCDDLYKCFIQNLLSIKMKIEQSSIKFA